MALIRGRKPGIWSVLVYACMCVCAWGAKRGRNGDFPPPVGARYGHFDPARRGARGLDASPNGRNGAAVGGNVFWKQWHLPFRANGSRNGLSEDDDDIAYQDPYEVDDYAHDTDRRPWSDLIPRLRIKVEPMTTLKLRKRFYPFGALIELGADYNTQLGVWQFRSSVEDRFIGGRFSVKGRELQFSKSWLVTLGENDDLAARLKFRAGLDTATWRSYARLGFRTERIQPINLKEGVSIRRRLPLDGNEGHATLEFKANLALPEPEIEYSTDKKRLIMGTGDIQLNLEELNLCLEY